MNENKEIILELDDEPPGKIQTPKEFDYFVRSSNYPNRCLGRVFAGERSLPIGTSNHSYPSNPDLSGWFGMGMGTRADGER